MKRFFVFILSFLSFAAGLIISLETPIMAQAEHEIVTGLSLIGIFGGAFGICFFIAFSKKA